MAERPPSAKRAPFDIDTFSVVLGHCAAVRRYPQVRSCSPRVIRRTPLRQQLPCLIGVYGECRVRVGQDTPQPEPDAAGVPALAINPRPHEGTGAHAADASLEGLR